MEHVRAFLFHSTEQDGNGLEELAAVMLPASKARKQWAKSGKKHSDPDHNPMDDEVEEKYVMEYRTYSCMWNTNFIIIL